MYIPKDTNFICLQLSKDPEDSYDQILSELGFNGVITTIDNPETLLSDIKDKSDFQYIILDGHDDENLHKLVTQIKELENYIGQPIIVLNTITTKEVMQDCLNAGASDYIVKPFLKETLANKIVKTWK